MLSVPLSAVSAEKIESSQAEPKRSQQLFQQWEKIKTPSQGDPEPVGTYAAGCLLGAKKLPPTGRGFAVMKLGRQRYFGHPQLIQFLTQMGAGMAANHWGNLLIGDMGRACGGPMISGHASHQIGLDVDLWYLFPKKIPNTSLRESMNSPSVVWKQKEKVNRKFWTKIHAQVLAFAAKKQSVDRIFVNPLIKAELCKKADLYKDWIWKIRPWWGHDDHFHVRLSCPQGAKNCQPQEALDRSNLGCDKKELAWWTSKEAQEELNKRQKSLAKETRIFPKLPAECEEILR